MRLEDMQRHLLGRLHVYSVGGRSFEIAGLGLNTILLLLYDYVCLNAMNAVNAMKRQSGDIRKF